jgi:hypothetical protein
MSGFSITAYVSNLFTFSSLLIKSNLLSVLTVFLRFFIWIALGDVAVHFSLILVTEANAVEGGTISAM